jgi:hypothetical protein
MSKYLGDFTAGDVIDFKFTTFSPSTGAPFTLAGTPVVSVYKDNSVTQDTAGAVLTVDFDGVTGLHHVRVTANPTGGFYTNGGEFECVITTGTVDSVSVVGSCVGRFTLGATAANVYNALLASYTTADTFGARLVRSATSSTTNEVVINASNHLAANVHQMQNNVVTAASIASDAITSAKIADASLTAAKFGDSALVISSGAAGGVKAYLAAGSITAGVIATGAIDADALATDASNEIADALLNRNIGGGSSAGRLVKEALYALRNKTSITGTLLTVCDENDDVLLPSWTANLTTSASADPVTGIDPV